MTLKEISKSPESTLEELKDDLSFLESLNLQNENLPELSDEWFRKKLSKILWFEIQYRKKIDSTISETEFKVDEIIIKFWDRMNSLLSKSPEFKNLKLDKLNELISKKIKFLESKIKNWFKN